MKVASQRRGPHDYRPVSVTGASTERRMSHSICRWDAATTTHIPAAARRMKLCARCCQSSRKFSTRAPRRDPARVVPHDGVPSRNQHRESYRGRMIIPVSVKVQAWSGECLTAFEGGMQQLQRTHLSIYPHSFSHDGTVCAILWRFRPQSSAQQQCFGVRP